jgi:putative toxin-antitoxin system antitoxin component (TIGR02293 family)
MWQRMIDTVAAAAYCQVMGNATEMPMKVPVERKQQPARIAHRVKGHYASLGVATTDTSELIRRIEAGLAFAALQRLDKHTGLGLSLLASIIGIPERTLARRKASGKLSPEESERLIRISRIFERTMELFEDDLAAAVRWLTSPKKALDNQQPLQYARTELGAREVDNLLGRLEYGVFS